jgi:hypothetical protein
MNASRTPIDLLKLLRGIMALAGLMDVVSLLDEQHRSLAPTRPAQEYSASFVYKQKLV